MTQLFIRFYLSVLLVLFVTWYIHGVVLEKYRHADMDRAVEGAYGGGARLVANELDSAPPADRQALLENLRKRFGYPLEIVTLDDLPTEERRRISHGDDVVYYKEGRVGSFIFTPLSGGTEVVRLGALPRPDADHIEKGLGGGMRLAAARLDAAADCDWDAVLENLRKGFDYPIEIVSPDDVPPFQRWRMARGDEVVFYGNEEADRYFVLTPISGGTQAIRFGPFPNFERSESIATAPTLALVLLPAALAIALLLRPVARQLRRVEDGATGARLQRTGSRTRPGSGEEDYDPTRRQRRGVEQSSGRL